MTTHCMHSYSLLAIKTCHRRGIHAIGGMAARFHQERQGSERKGAGGGPRRQGARGHRRPRRNVGGAPGLVDIAKTAFDANMSGPNQVGRQRDDVQVTAEDLLTVPSGEITEGGLCKNIDVGIQYMANWLRATAACPFTTSWKTRPPRKSPAPTVAMAASTNRRLVGRPESHAGVDPPAF